MKKFIKVSLLLACVPFALAACEDFEKKCFCMETSTTLEYVEGKCYQASYKDILETIYVINLPINPEADPSEYKYDITFVAEVKNTYLTLTGGLEGKKINSVFRLDDNIIKVNIQNVAQDEEATYGYIKISERAFTANTDRVRNANLYAYVALGEQSNILVDKPTINDDGTIAQ